MKIDLFSTDGCHLCEQAIAMFYHAQANGLVGNDISLNIIDIVESQDLVERYGERIPVLNRSIDKQPQELGWPFEYQELIDWIEQT